MNAIVKMSGKQYQVIPGSVIKVDSIKAELGTLVTLDEVLMVSSEGKTIIGTPCVPSAKVIAEVKEQWLGPKLRVLKKKRRKNYRRVIGCRQLFTSLEVKEIVV